MLTFNYHYLDMCPLFLYAIIEISQDCVEVQNLLSDEAE
jgi:hypothetical protein